MQRTKIEWCRNADGSPGYTWNPVTGCYGPGGTKERPNHCPYCYAKRIAERFAGGKVWPNGFEPTWRPEREYEPAQLSKPSRIFVGSMCDLFGAWVPRDWIDRVLWMVKGTARHTFIFLTKHFRMLARHNPWPTNAWVGATAEDGGMVQTALHSMRDVNASVKFLSIEPLLRWRVDANISTAELYYKDFLVSPVHWLIIGARTNPLRLPERQWVEDIEAAADKAGVPIFEKNSLTTLFPERKLRQEWPE